MNIEGKYALVTGGNAGIGLAITRGLTEAGAHVLVVGRDHGRLESARAGSNRVTVLQADLTSALGREQVIAHVRAGETPLDILVNNAGTMQYFDVNRSTRWSGWKRSSPSTCTRPSIWRLRSCRS